MSFNLYNLLASLIPGFTLYLVGVYVFGIDTSKISEISSIAVAYILGYFINLISSWLENIYFWTWGGDPATQLLEGKKCGRIKFYEKDKVNKFVKDLNESSNKKIFQIAMRISSESKRVSEMSASYAFSRSILTTIILSYFVLLKVYSASIGFHIISVVILLLAWHRAKERGFYYAKEVLSNAINSK